MGGKREKKKNKNTTFLWNLLLGGLVLVGEASLDPVFLFNVLIVGVHRTVFVVGLMAVLRTVFVVAHVRLQRTVSVCKRKN